MDGWMDGWVDGWMDGWMGGWMDGWMDGCVYVKYAFVNTYVHMGMTSFYIFFFTR